MKHGKKYSDAAKAFDRATQFEPAEAIALAKKSAVAKFDETIEVHIRTGLLRMVREARQHGSILMSSMSYLIPSILQNICSSSGRK